MQLKQNLIETFQYNDWANRKALEKIRQLPEKDEAVKIFSHLINSMNKWLERFAAYPQQAKMSWWEPAYPVDELETRWNACLARWLDFLESKSEEELLAEVRVAGDDGNHYAAPLKDIALQLNYHSIHHRAIIQSIIRAQGLEPDFVDYIGTVYRKIG